MTDQKDSAATENAEGLGEQRYMRKIRSFVKREGRMTNRQ